MGHLVGGMYCILGSASVTLSLIDRSWAFLHQKSSSLYNLAFVSNLTYKKSPPPLLQAD